MGSWTEVCCVTRVPIRRGDRVVMLVPTEKAPLERGYSIFDLYTGIRISSYQHQLEYFEKGTYNDYGWLEEIKEKDNDSRPDLRSFFVIERVWDEIQSNCKINEDTYSDGMVERIVKEGIEEYERIQDLLEKSGIEKFGDYELHPENKYSIEQISEIMRFVLFCNLNRIDISAGDIGKGGQFLPDPGNFKAMRFINDMTAKEIDRLEEECKKEEEL